MLLSCLFTEIKVMFGFPCFKSLNIKQSRELGAVGAQRGCTKVREEELSYLWRVLLPEHPVQGQFICMVHANYVFT